MTGKRRSQEALGRVPGTASYHVVILGRHAYVLCIFRGLQLMCGSTISFPVSSWETLPPSFASLFGRGWPGTKPLGSGFAKEAWLFAGLRGGHPLRTVSETLMRSLFNCSCELPWHLGESRNTLHNN